MLVYYEFRRRLDNGDLYRVKTWYFLGIPVYRRWEQLTTHQPVLSRS